MKIHCANPATAKRFSLPMNLWVGRVTPCAPFRPCPNPGAHGVTRPTCTNWFRGSMREVLKGNLSRLAATLSSPSDGEERAGRGEASVHGEGVLQDG